jgi:hypothetical protein
LDALRTRLGVAFEWAVALVCILALLALGSLVGRGLRDLRAVPAVLAGERPAQEPPAAVPLGAVSVPMLLLSTGVELRVGDRLSSVESKIGRDWQVGADAIERTDGGERMTRLYEDGARQFALVFNPDEDERGTRVGGIYVR